MQLLWISGFHLEQKLIPKPQDCHLFLWLYCDLWSRLLPFRNTCIYPCVVFCRWLFILLSFLTIVLSVFLLFTDYDYTFSVFNLFVTTVSILVAWHFHMPFNLSSLVFFFFIFYLPNLSFPYAPDLTYQTPCLLIFPAFLVSFMLTFLLTLWFQHMSFANVKINLKYNLYSVNYV